MSGFDNLSQNVFGLVALIVSLVALVTTVLQVLQQYYSSAEGYRRCAPSVMGLVRSLFLPLSNFVFQTSLLDLRGAELPRSGTRSIL